MPIESSAPFPSSSSSSSSSTFSPPSFLTPETASSRNTNLSSPPCRLFLSADGCAARAGAAAATRHRKAGRLTVFITPPPTPKPFPSLGEPRKGESLAGASAVSDAASAAGSGAAAAVREGGTEVAGIGVRLLQGAVARVQEVHSSLDEYLANLFGLNRSKYQWALNDYYENQGKDYEGSKCSKPKGTY
uniref:Uncharacterized protein n=1 Tax=Ananas comosus var. bracteatus TaxID=296719 RepID=A0A6V7P5M5_ANACO|nr:unnamed protein product [Ananas comosus var. bracteatus]